MFRFFPIILLLQFYCVYHAYLNKAEQKWYWIIIIFPLFGSLYYLYHHFYFSENIEHLSTNLETTLNTNYQINNLEEQYQFSNTIYNTITLAEEHFKLGNHSRSLELYELSLQGNHSEDQDIIKEIIRNAYHLEAYQKVTEYSKKLTNQFSLKQSDVKLAVAWSFYQIEDYESALVSFQDLDHKYSNYEERMQFAQFYNLIDERSKAIAILDEMLNEIGSLQQIEKKDKQHIFDQIKYFKSQL